MAHYPLARAFRPALVWPLALLLALLISWAVPLLFLPLLLLSPVLLVICGIRAGLAPMAVCGLMIPGAAWLIFLHPLAPVLCALYLWPLLIAHGFCFAKQVPFWRAAAIHVAALAAGQTVILLFLRGLVGGDLFLGGAEWMVGQIALSPYGDRLLIMLYQNGLLALPQEMLAEAQFMMTPQIRLELLNGLRRVMESALYSSIPNLLITSAMLLGVFGVAFPIVAARRLGIPVMDMPPFAAWHLSKSAGMKVLILAAGPLLPRFFPNPGMLLAGNMMWAAFLAVFAIQGAAVMDHFQQKAGRRTRFRWVWPSVCFLLFPTLLQILGVADQLFNIRGLRVSKDKEED